MKYHTLKGMFYDDRNNFEQNYLNRFNNSVSVKTSLKIYPFDNHKQTRYSEKFEIFYLPNQELSLLIESIYANSKKIEKKTNNRTLPGVAKDQLFKNALINEIQSTNEIEGVYSTKQEINSVINQVKEKNPNIERFKGLVSQYLRIMNEEPTFTITKFSDFREIWNNLLSKKEVDEMPDGKYFRKSGVYIQNGDIRIHEGDESEKEIISDLKCLIKLLNNNEIPKIEKSLITHFFYEYIHPFYDGNGRNGRYILCSYIAKVLDPLSTITFSSTIAKNKSQYYKAFKDMEDPYNRGEITLFIIKMLNILKNGQKILIDTIDKNIESLNKLTILLNKYKNKTDQLESEILFIFCQKEIFGSKDDFFTDNDLVNITKKSRYLINKSMDSLVKKGFLESKNMKPKIHNLSKNFIEKINEN